jgi:hypothetical protein
MRRDLDRIVSYFDGQPKRDRGFREAERDLGYVAVCLIGPAQPVRFQKANTLHWPVRLRTATDPARAPSKTVSEHWEGSKDQPFVTLLEHVWTMSDAHASRLKSALYARLVGSDPELRLLNNTWVDLPEWREVWGEMLNEAIRDLRAGGEVVEAFSSEMRNQRIMRHAQRRLRR